MKRRLLYKLLIGGVFFLPLIPLYANYWLVPAFERLCDRSITGLKCRLQEGRISWAGWRHPLSGQIEMLELQHDKGAVILQDVLVSVPVPFLHPKENILLRSAQVHIQAPTLFPKPLVLKNLRANVLVRPDDITLKSLRFRLDDGKARLQGRLHQQQLTFKARVRNVDLAKLTDYWPVSLAVTPRRWVLKNIPHGTVDQATLELEAQLTPTELQINDIKGQIEAHDVEVHYLGHLPAVHQVKGIATYTAKDFRIKILEGRVWGIQLPEGQVDITDLDKPDQQISINLQLNGPIGAALKILNQKPLHFASKVNLDPNEVDGRAETYLHLNFLLETDTPLDAIQVYARSQISGAKLNTHKIIGNQPLWLTAERLDLFVDRDHFVLEGPATLNQWRGDFYWEEIFRQDQRTFYFDTQLPAASLKKIGWELQPYLQGDMNLRLFITEKKDAPSQWNATMDLTPTFIEILGWEKQRGVKAELQAKGRMPFALDFVKLVGNDCKVTVVTQGNHLKIEPSRMGKSAFQGHIKELGTGVPLVTINAKILDLSSLFQLDESTVRQSHFNWRLLVNADKIICTSDLVLDHGKVEAHWKNGHLRKLDAQATTGVAQAPFQLTLHQDQVFLHTSEGGSLLETLGTGYDLRQGDLTIQGTRTLMPGGDWTFQGQLQLDNVHVTQAPLLSRLLAAASLQGMLELLTGQGITFTQTRGEFTLTPRQFTLQQLKMSNNGLGLLIVGTIDYVRRQADLQGELYPFYFINSLLAQIPLISGGRAGVFATTFTLSGPLDDLALSVNPLATVAPGVLRQVWGA